MPLKKGSSRATISKNIATERRAGKPAEGQDDCVVGSTPYAAQRAGPSDDGVPPGYWTALDGTVRRLPAVPDADFDIEPFV